MAPHWIPLIPELSPDAEGALATRAAMQEPGRRCAPARPDMLIVATSHGGRVEWAIALASVAQGFGILRWRGRQIEMNVPIDGPLTELIAAIARLHDVQTVLTGFGRNQREFGSIPLDWGAMVPL